MTCLNKLTKKYAVSLIAASLFLVLIVTLFSCGIGVRTRSLLGGRLHVTVNIAENANQNSPIALDLLFVYDEELLEKLLKMSAKEWFEKREQIRRDYPEGEGLDYWGWEWVPGQKIPVQEMPLKAESEAAMIFANYLSPGSHRARVDPFKDMRIRLSEKEFLVESLK